ncbi:MAG TPA: hypothetical protein VG755_19220 [Nannocystaceae bacterium]|nr:hypothetical protein [Nannocystaceae bacterium]
MLAFTGCAPVGDDHEGPSGELPSPYEDDGEPDGSPALSREQVGAAATAGLRAFTSLQPQTVVDLYRAIAVHDDECPEEFEEIVENGTTAQTWYTDGCTTAAGVQFAGGGRIEIYTRTEEPGYDVTGAILNAEGASLSVVAADGRSLTLSGYVAWQHGTSEDSTDSSLEIYGHALADAASAAGNPLLDGSISVQGYMYSYAGEGSKEIGGEGAISGARIGDARAFSFAGIGVYSDGCTAEPMGTVSVRDVNGFWHDIAFDGIVMVDEEPTFDAAACDGCGEYLAAGEPDGEACVAAGELAQLLAWEEFAW